MKNCFVTSYKKSIDNDSLRFLGKIKFNIPYVESGSDVYLEIRSSVAIDYSSTKENLTAGSIVTPTDSLKAANSDVKIGNVEGGCIITIDNPYAITKFGINAAYGDSNSTLKKAINEQFDILEFASGLKGLNYNSVAPDINFKCLSTAFSKKKWDSLAFVSLPYWPGMQEAVEYYAARSLKVCIPSTNVYQPLFRLSHAIANTGLQYIYIRDEDFLNDGFDNLPVSDLRTLGIQNCTGTLEALVAKLIDAGRVSGCLQIRLVSALPTNITLDGSKLEAWCAAHSVNATSNLYVTWDTGGTNISLTNTIPSNYVSSISWQSV